MLGKSSSDHGELEEGTTSSSLLYPGIRDMVNDMHWILISRVYYILATQILLTTAVSAIVALCAPIDHLLRGNIVLLVILVLLPLLLLLPLNLFQHIYPLNFIILGLFTVSLSIAVGVVCANTNGKIVLEALILASTVVLALTGYTFWASRRSQDYSFWGPVLFASLLVVVVTAFIQLLFPLGSTANAIYCAIGAIVFCAYIVYDTYNLIQNFSYYEYIWASVHLYLDILNLFNLFLDILRLLKPRNN